MDKRKFKRAVKRTLSFMLVAFLLINANANGNSIYAQEAEDFYEVDEVIYE